MVERVPFWRVVRNDYTSLVFLLPVLVVGPVTYGAVRDRGPRGALPYLVVAAAAVIAGVVALSRRVSAIREVLETGMKVKGRVTSVWFHEDRGRVEFEYEYAGKRQAGVAINRNASTESLRAGREIDIALHPERPDQPLVLGLYLESGFGPEAEEPADEELDEELDEDDEETRDDEKT